MTHDKKWLNRQEAIAFFQKNNWKQIGKYKFKIKHIQDEQIKICKRNIWYFSDSYIFWHNYARNHFWGTFDNLKRAYWREKAEKAYQEAKNEKEKTRAIIKISEKKGSVWESHSGQINILWFLKPTLVYSAFFHLVIKLINWRKMCGQKSKYDLELLEAIINNETKHIDIVIYDYQKKHFFIKYEKLLSKKQSIK